MSRPGHASAARFVEGPIASTLARFALPLLVTNFLHSLSGTWGAIWVAGCWAPTR